MAFEALIATMPYSTTVVSGFCVAAALSRATRGLRGGGGRDAQISRKWSLVSLGLFIAVVLAVSGVLAAGAEKMRDIRLLYLFGGAVCLAFPMFRFKKAIGLPLIFALIIATVLALLFFQSLAAFTGETEIAAARILFADGERMRLEVNVPKQPALQFDLEGEYFAPVVRVVIFDDMYVFLGYKTWYRLEGFTSFSVARDGKDFRFRQEDTDYYFAHPTGISRTLYAFFEQNEERIPGVKTVQVEIDLKKVRETDGGGESQKPSSLQRYSIRIQNDGGIQIVRED
jgi:hypothetical protein